MILNIIIKKNFFGYPGIIEINHYRLFARTTHEPQVAVNCVCVTTSASNFLLSKPVAKCRQNG